MIFKRHRSPDTPKPVLENVITIPDVFYGGKDPEHETGGQKIGYGKTNGGALSSSSASDSGRTKLIAGVMITIFLLALGGGGWYFYRYLGFGGTEIRQPVAPQPSSQESEPVFSEESASSTSAEIIDNATVVSTSTTEEITGVSAISPSSNSSTLPGSPETKSFAGLALEFPSLMEIDAPDLDADGLTDSEEELFGTDASMFDTDGDNYYDGQEVLNLYNPKGTTPIQLVDSGLVKEFIHPKNTYRVYYPLDWQVGAVDPIADTVLITASNGDYIEYRIVPKKPNQDFVEWFAENAPEERITELMQSLNRFNTTHWRRKDDLVGYVDNPNFVLAIVYHPNENGPVAFRTVMRLMFATLRMET